MKIRFVFVLAVVYVCKKIMSSLNFKQIICCKKFLVKNYVEVKFQYSIFLHTRFR